MAQQRFCTNCGAQIDADVAFCPACGQATGTIGAAISSTEQGSGQVRLTFYGTGLEALGWGLFLIITSIFIIPAGWGIAAMSRWLVGGVALDDGTRVEFHGRGSQIWGYPILNAAVQFLGVIPLVGAVIAWLVGIRIQLAIWRWFFGEVRLSSPNTNMEFTGEYWPFVGWSLLLILSFITVVGWAWVAAAYLRWIYRNINMGRNQVVFWGTPSEILWRGIVTVLVSIFIITMPWMAVWYIKWFVGNTTLERAPT